MKTFIKSMLAVLAVLVMLTGCAGMQSSLKSGVVKHEVELVITSNEPVTVEEIPKYSGLSVTDVKYLWNDITYIMEMTDIREMELFINSPGGDAFQGLALADQLERAQKLLPVPQYLHLLFANTEWQHQAHSLWYMKLHCGNGREEKPLLIFVPRAS
jgi:hypothetical protein